jgi:hypothetical protein
MVEATDPTGRKRDYFFVCATIFLWTAVVPFSRAFFWKQNSYTEGWNVFNAQKVAEHQALYPTVYAWTDVNYPALSFHLIAAIGKFIPDYLLIGRALSMLGLVLSAVFAGMIVRHATRSEMGAWLSGFYLLAVFCADATGRVGMDDPQMLAQAFFLAGLYVYCRSDRKGWDLELAALLFVVGGNIKHNAIEFPLAVLLDLLLSSPRTAMRFAVDLGLMAAVGVALTRRIDGAAYVPCLLAARDYSALNSFTQARNVLGPILLPTVVALVMAVYCWRSPSRRVLALLLGCALAVNTFFCGGRGVSINGMFGSVVAVVLLSGLFIAEISKLPVGPVRALSPPQAWTVLFLWLTIPMIVWGNWQTENSLERDRASERRFGEEVAFLRQQPGPALCESLLRCYYAGKPYVYDPFNASRFMEQGKLDPGVMVDQLRKQEFGAIQMKGSVTGKLEDARDRERFPEPILEAIDAYYHPGFENGYGTIYVPKGEDQLALAVRQSARVVGAAK